ncbi:MAG: hypothetical protein IFK91_11040, partial [Acidobacteria bacterium]|nr:hypothetical protein [Candidatus Sulfomarinibacter sp. MAG AM1]
GFSHFGVLDVLSSTTPRPSDRKPHWARHLADLATKAGEKSGLARWFANGNLVLRELTSSDRGWAEVRCWPHHFDLGTVISLESSGDASSGRSIGVGLSPGDTSYSEPYLYVNPYGLTDQPANQPPLESGAHWHTDGWFGAVLTATAIVVNPGGTQESAVLSFLHGAVDAARNLLTE